MHMIFGTVTFTLSFFAHAVAAATTAAVNRLEMVQNRWCTKAPGKKKSSKISHIGIHVQTHSWARIRPDKLNRIIK